MLIKCEDCGHDVSDKAVACIFCGCPINPNNSTLNTNQALNTPRKCVRKRNVPMARANGTGSIRKLSGRRRKPYGAYPAITKYHENGSAILPKAIGYYATYKEALEALTIYNIDPYDLDKATMTFEELYTEFYTFKYENMKRNLSYQSKAGARCAFKNCASLHKLPFAKLRTDDFQQVLNDCTKKHATLELINSLFKQMSTYALQRDYIEKDYAQFVKIMAEDDDESGEPFYEDEIAKLWEHSDDPIIQKLLIFIYSGYRISAFKKMEINLEEGYFKGGVKTEASKGRLVPIHSKILPLIKEDTFYKFDTNAYRLEMHEKLEEIGLNTSRSGKVHTPHDCRHTFSWLCDKYGVSDVSKHLLMGHKLKGDVENKVYSHKTYEELKEEIEKITV